MKVVIFSIKMPKIYQFFFVIYVSSFCLICSAPSYGVALLLPMALHRFPTPRPAIIHFKMAADPFCWNEGSFLLVFFFRFW